RGISTVRLQDPQIPLRQDLNLGLIQRRDRFRITFAATDDSAQFACHVAEILQLSGAVRLWMAGYDLLDQTGAGTRHTKDEQRLVAGQAAIRPSGKKIGIKQFQHAVDTIIKSRCVEWLAPEMH